MICYLYPEPLYFFFSSDLPPLLYYTHIPSAVVALLVGFFVFWSGRQFLLNRLLLVISILFSFWVIANLITWTNIHSGLISFVWSLLGFIQALIAILSIYFIYVFLKNKDVTNKIKIVFLFLLAPVFIFTPTDYNLAGFNLTDCDTFKFEKLPFEIYYTSLGILAMVWILFLLVRHYRSATFEIKKEIVLVGIGIESFLFTFFAFIFVAAYLTNLGILSDSRFEMYGLLGMVVLMIYISVIIVRFKVFNVKLIGAQALVWSLVILIGSQFFFIKVTINYYLTGISLLGTIIVGWMIVQNVKREIAQKERIQRLAESLESSNKRLEEANEKLRSLDAMKSEFVSLATHQIRGPLAAIKGYVSLLEEGDYGEVPQTFKEPLDTVFKSTDSLSRMVTDFLDVSRLDLGQMKYEFADFDFRDLANEVIKEFSPGIKAKGLDLKIKITDSSCPINADRVKLRQVLNNLVDNSAKYTKQGFMEISVENKGGKILFAVKDSGVGISQKTIAVLFQRFSRAKNANETNILGTGLGLYVAKKMTEANKGRVWAESEGEGKGAQFYVELPVKS